jgi:hypothetical protein
MGDTYADLWRIGLGIEIVLPDPFNEVLPDD